MIDRTKTVDRSVYAFLERVLPASTGLFLVLILASSRKPLAMGLICLGHVGLNVALSQWLQRLQPERRISAEHVKNLANIALVSSTILWSGPGSNLWVLHFLPILRSLIAFPGRGTRLLTAFTFGGSASITEWLAGAEAAQALEPVIVLFAPALVMESLFEFFEKALTKEHKKRLEGEDARRISSRMEAVGNLAAGLAHEINTPVQYVSDSLSFIREATEDLLKLVDRFDAILDPRLTEDPKVGAIQRQLVEHEREIDTAYLHERLPQALMRAQDGLDRVASLVLSVRTFSHPGSTLPAREDLNEAIQATVTISSSAWRDVAEVRLDLRPLPPILCCLGEINQVILNLLVNSADAIRSLDPDEKGLIEIATFKEDATARLVIRDNGTGIEPEELERVFDLFYTTKDTGKGTGQGLAIAKGVIERRHGGSIRIRSRPGQGTCVEIFLPIDGKEGNNEA